MNNVPQAFIEKLVDVAENYPHRVYLPMEMGRYPAMINWLIDNRNCIQDRDFVHFVYTDYRQALMRAVCFRDSNEEFLFRLCWS